MYFQTHLVLLLLLLLTSISLGLIVVSLRLIAHCTIMASKRSIGFRLLLYDANQLVACALLIYKYGLQNCSEYMQYEGMDSPYVVPCFPNQAGVTSLVFAVNVFILSLIALFH